MIWPFTLIKSRSLEWMAVGAVLGLGAPIGLWICLSLLNPTPNSLMTIVYIYSGLSTCLAFALFGYATGRLIQKNEDISNHDALTGLFNRRYFFKRFEEYLSLSERYSHSVSLLILDLDHFKSVNDRFGHLVGDQTLKSVAQVMRQESRKSDISARLGGEEFVVLCPNTDKQEASLLAERLREKISKLTEADLGYPGPQTTSIGVVTPEGDQHLEGPLLLQKADELLYKAKAMGRNRVVAE